MVLRVIVAGLAALAVQTPLLQGPPTAEQFGWAREGLNRQMIDYPSARFRDVRADRRRICGYVNGKNRVGAYSGWQRFYVPGIRTANPVFETDDRIGQIELLCDQDTPALPTTDYSDRLTHR